MGLYVGHLSSRRSPGIPWVGSQGGGLDCSCYSCSLGQPPRGQLDDLDGAPRLLNSCGNQDGLDNQDNLWGQDGLDNLDAPPDKLEDNLDDMDNLLGQHDLGVLLDVLLDVLLGILLDVLPRNRLGILDNILRGILDRKGRGTLSAWDRKGGSWRRTADAPHANFLCSSSAPHNMRPTAMGDPGQDQGQGTC